MVPRFQEIRVFFTRRHVSNADKMGRRHFNPSGQRQNSKKSRPFGPNPKGIFAVDPTDYFSWITGQGRRGVASGPFRPRPPASPTGFILFYKNRLTTPKVKPIKRPKNTPSPFFNFFFKDYFLNRFTKKVFYYMTHGGQRL